MAYKTRSKSIISKLPQAVLALLMLQSPLALGLAAPVLAQDGQLLAPAEGEIKTGAEPVVVDEVRIEGNRLIPTEDIASVVKTRKGDKFSREQVMEDLKAINGMGYFNDRNLEVNPELTPSGVLLKIRVEENAPITQFSIRGNEAISTDEISKLFNDQLGKPQNINALSGAIEKVEQAYHDRGFVLAKVADVKDDPDGSVELVISEGSIDNIEIVGNKKTKDFIFKNAIKIKPGSVYNEKQLTGDLRKLYNNGYFQDIRRSLVPSATNPDKYTLKVEVDEKRTGSVGLGGGVDSVAGPFGSFSFSDANFGGKGQVISLSSQMGSGNLNNVAGSINNGGTNYMPTGRTYNLEASFIEPNLKGTNTSMAITGFGRNMGSMFIDQAMQRTLGTSVVFSKPLRSGWSANLGLIGENTTLRNMAGIAENQSVLASMSARALSTGLAANSAEASALANSIRGNQLKGGTFFTVSPSLSRDTRDAAFDPTRGSLVKLTASPSIGAGGGFFKTGVSASKYIPVSKNITFASNLQAGTSMGGMPQFAQYRLGGWNGVRGYRAFSDLGTGAGLLMGTAELRAKIPLPETNAVFKAVRKNAKLVAFADYGQVMGNGVTNNLLSRNSMGASVGVGVRLNVPMLGLVRIDYGLPIISSVLGRRMPLVTVGFGEKF